MDFNKVLQPAIGMNISCIDLDKDKNVLTLRDINPDTQIKVQIWDDGQQCCEYRYMTTDDKLDSFEESKLMGIEVRDGGYREDGGDIQFLLIHTSLGTFTIENHNEHNGYYAGFEIVVSVTSDAWAVLKE